VTGEIVRFGLNTIAVLRDQTLSEDIAARSVLLLGVQ